MPRTNGGRRDVGDTTGSRRIASSGEVVPKEAGPMGHRPKRRSAEVEEAGVQETASPYHVDEGVLVEQMRVLCSWNREVTRHTSTDDPRLDQKAPLTGCTVFGNALSNRIAADPTKQGPSDAFSCECTTSETISTTCQSPQVPVGAPLGHFKMRASCKCHLGIAASHLPFATHPHLPSFLSSIFPASRRTSYLRLGQKISMWSFVRAVSLYT